MTAYKEVEKEGILCFRIGREISELKHAKIFKHFRLQVHSLSTVPFIHTGLASISNFVRSGSPASKRVVNEQTGQNKSE